MPKELGKDKLKKFKTYEILSAQADRTSMIDDIDLSNNIRLQSQITGLGLTKIQQVYTAVKKIRQQASIDFSLDNSECQKMLNLGLQVLEQNTDWSQYNAEDKLTSLQIFNKINNDARSLAETKQELYSVGKKSAAIGAVFSTNPWIMALATAGLVFSPDIIMQKEEFCISKNLLNKVLDDEVKIGDRKFYSEIKKLNLTNSAREYLQDEYMFRNIGNQITMGKILPEIKNKHEINTVCSKFIKSLRTQNEKEQHRIITQLDNVVNSAEGNNENGTLSKFISNCIQKENTSFIPLLDENYDSLTKFTHEFNKNLTTIIEQYEQGASNSADANIRCKIVDDWRNCSKNLDITTFANSDLVNKQNFVTEQNKWLFNNKEYDMYSSLPSPSEFDFNHKINDASMYLNYKTIINFAKQQCISASEFDNPNKYFDNLRVFFSEIYENSNNRYGSSLVPMLMSGKQLVQKTQSYFNALKKPTQNTSKIPKNIENKNDFVFKNKTELQSAVFQEIWNNSKLCDLLKEDKNLQKNVSEMVDYIEKQKKRDEDRVTREMISSGINGIKSLGMIASSNTLLTLGSMCEATYLLNNAKDVFDKIDFSKMLSSKISTGDLVNAFGGAGMILTASNIVVQLLSKPKPDVAHQIIMEHLKHISEQIRKLHLDMHKRFDKLDILIREKFKLIFNSIHDRIDHMEERLQNGVEEIKYSIKESFTSINNNLELIQEYNQNFAKATVTKSLNNATRKIDNYLYGIESGDMSYEEYSSCLDEFCNWIEGKNDCQSVVNGAFIANKNIDEKLKILANKKFDVFANFAYFKGIFQNTKDNSSYPNLTIWLKALDYFIKTRKWQITAGKKNSPKDLYDPEGKQIFDSIAKTRLIKKSLVQLKENNKIPQELINKLNVDIVNYNKYLEAGLNNCLGTIPFNYFNHMLESQSEKNDQTSSKKDWKHLMKEHVMCDLSATLSCYLAKERSDKKLDKINLSIVSTQGRQNLNISVAQLLTLLNGKNFVIAPEIYWALEAGIGNLSLSYEATFIPAQHNGYHNTGTGNHFEKHYFYNNSCSYTININYQIDKTMYPLVKINHAYSKNSETKSSHGRKNCRKEQNRVWYSNGLSNKQTTTNEIKDQNKFIADKWNVPTDSKCVSIQTDQLRLAKETASTYLQKIIKSQEKIYKELKKAKKELALSLLHIKHYAALTGLSNQLNIIFANLKLDHLLTKINSAQKNNIMFKQKRLFVDTHWYTEAEINRLLQHVVVNHENVYLFPAVLSNTLRNSNNNQVNMLADLLQNRWNEIPTNVTRVIIPLNRNNLHWTGIIIHLKTDRTVPNNIIDHIDYIDGQGYALSNDVTRVLLNFLQTYATNINHNTIIRRRINQANRLQHDCHSCGPLLVEVIGSILTDDTIPANNIDLQQLRTQHRNIILGNNVTNVDDTEKTKPIETDIEKDDTKNKEKKVDPVTDKKFNSTKLIQQLKELFNSASKIRLPISHPIAKIDFLLEELLKLQQSLRLGANNLPDEKLQQKFPHLRLVYRNSDMQVKMLEKERKMLQQERKLLQKMQRQMFMQQQLMMQNVLQLLPQGQRSKITEEGLSITNTPFFFNTNNPSEKEDEDNSKEASRVFTKLCQF